MRRLCRQVGYARRHPRGSRGCRVRKCRRRGETVAHRHLGHEGLKAFWDTAIASVDKFECEINGSFANPEGNTCANIGKIKTSFADGSYTTTELIMIYVVNEEGRVKSMKAFWEPERTMASFTKP